MATLRLTDVTFRDAFEATEASLREQGFRLAERNPAGGYLRSFPAESTMSGGTGSLSDALVRPANAVRRLAEAQVTSREGSVAVRYRVTIERLDTAKVRAWTREHEVSDAPVETPIDQDQGTLPAQNETWTFIRRDGAMEQQIRAAILERIGRTPAGSHSS